VTNEAKVPDYGWTNQRALAWVLDDAPVPVELFPVLTAIARRADDKGERSYQSPEKIAEKVGKSADQVRRDIKKLVGLKLIKRGDQTATDHLPEGKRPTVYDVCWTVKGAKPMRQSKNSTGGPKSSDVGTGGMDARGGIHATPGMDAGGRGGMDATGRGCMDAPQITPLNNPLEKPLSLSDADAGHDAPAAAPVGEDGERGDEDFSNLNPNGQQDGSDSQTPDSPAIGADLEKRTDAEGPNQLVEAADDCEMCIGWGGTPIEPCPCQLRPVASTPAGPATNKAETGATASPAAPKPKPASAEQPTVNVSAAARKAMSKIGIDGEDADRVIIGIYEMRADAGHPIDSDGFWLFFSNARHPDRLKDLRGLVAKARKPRNAGPQSRPRGRRTSSPYMDPADMSVYDEAV